MRKCLPVIFLFLLIAACKDKKKTVNTDGGEVLATSDFFEAFPSLKLPYTIYDTAMDDAGNTDTIGYDAFTRFASDTVLKITPGKGKNLSIYPIGRFDNKKREYYLLARVKNKNTSEIILMVFDKSQKFSASIPLLISTDNKSVSSATIDNRFAITINKEWKSDDEPLYYRSIYAYNNTGAFTLVMTETNDQSKNPNTLNNSLDTLPRKNKYSGDYVKGKNNMVSIRDGKTPATYRFFVHFKNDDEENCSGELKGELTMKTATSGTYAENNDPCVVDFTFTASQVTVKEQGSCGSYRGIKCFFNHTYVKKKEPKQKEPKPVRKR